MKNRDPAFDAYLKRAEDFARPIMEKIRKAAHKACPEIREVIKWGHPSFELEGIVAGMSANKKHVRFGFWKGALLDAGGDLPGLGSLEAVRFEKPADVPAQKVLVAWFKQAVQLNRDGIKPPRKTARKRPAPKAPADLLAALKKNPKALAAYRGFSPSHQREYIQWITEAKREATREKRIVQAVTWMAEGKSRNWKYVKR